MSQARALADGWGEGSLSLSQESRAWRRPQASNFGPSGLRDAPPKQLSVYAIRRGICECDSLL